MRGRIVVLAIALLALQRKSVGINDFQQRLPRSSESEKFDFPRYSVVILHPYSKHVRGVTDGSEQYEPIPPARHVRFQMHGDHRKFANDRRRHRISDITDEHNDLIVAEDYRPRNKRHSSMYLPAVDRYYPKQLLDITGYHRTLLKFGGRYHGGRKAMTSDMKKSAAEERSAKNEGSVNKKHDLTAPTKVLFRQKRNEAPSERSLLKQHHNNLKETNQVKGNLRLLLIHGSSFRSGTRLSEPHTSDTSAHTGAALTDHRSDGNRQRRPWLKNGPHEKYDLKLLTEEDLPDTDYLRRNRRGILFDMLPHVLNDISIYQRTYMKHDGKLRGEPEINMPAAINEIALN
ncbi:unnamed protein product [Soboliphyme baturini]|uniref:Secreted protein n=1 Tax=Soboliphyme baturini TaxID=241478 RepID=A0A183J9L4_9BILA|nr:unnamed protein product [Soboliphyme baturini]